MCLLPCPDSDTFTYDKSGRMQTAVSGRDRNTVGCADVYADRKFRESLTISGQTYTTGDQRIIRRGS